MPNQPLAKEAIQHLFTEARCHHSWLDKQVSDETLHQLYDVSKWGPTSVNSVPARFVFVKSNAAKEKLYPSLMGSNVEQVKTAPVCVIVAYDQKFYELLPRLFTHMDARPMFQNNEQLSESTAFRNGTLQGAYFILAIRALGLDAGPMSGFDNSKVDEAFFKETNWKTNFLCNLGYGDYTKVHPRGARLEFSEACKIL